MSVAYRFGTSTDEARRVLQKLQQCGIVRSTEYTWDEGRCLAWECVSENPSVSETFH
jgi:hypothetical protein